MGVGAGVGFGEGLGDGLPDGDGLPEADGLPEGDGLADGLGLGVGDGRGTPPSSAPTLRSRSEMRHSKALSAVRPNEVKTNMTPIMTSVFDRCFRRCLPLTDLPPSDFVEPK
jgi:hypothetical protein